MNIELNSHQNKELIWHDWCCILSEVWVAVRKAWAIRHGKDGIKVELPSVVEDCYLSKIDIKRIIVFVDALIIILFFWKPGRCFYRSYSIASVLRARGIKIVLNLGCLHFMNKKSRAFGHCWLTLNGSFFAEKNDHSMRFPVYFGCNDKDVQYWFKPCNNDELQKK